MLRVYRWFKNLEYNQVSTELFDKEAKGLYFSLYAPSRKTLGRNSPSTSKLFLREKSDNTIKLSSDIAKLREKISKLRKFHSLETSNQQMILVTLFTYSVAFFFAFLFCKFGSGCEVLSDAAWMAVSMYSGVIGIVGIAFSFYVHKKTSSLPDPYGIMFEIKYSIMITLTMFFVYSCVTFTVPIPVIDGKRKFEFGFIADIGLFLSFLLVVVFPLRVILESSRKKSENEVCLASILDTKIGLKLFRSYLVYELSVENLNFYLVAKTWRAKFVENARFNKKTAKNIIQKWIGNLEDHSVVAPYAINIGYLLKMRILKRFKENKVDEDLFDEAVDEVYALMSLDSFERFTKTARYKEYFQSKGTLVERIL
eukprot:snap_masked-scaffold_42-processed-gene-0.1-mRNA-1 protein AED:1.00 eAED:1.00 QI:0/-1/0/0/-1/1/1/0/367